MREIMEKLYVYIDVPVPAKPPSMKSKVQALRQEWVRVAGEAEQAAEISGQLRRFLVKAREFFDRLDHDHPTRLCCSHPSQIGPERPVVASLIEDQRAREWKARHEFFDRVAHHGDCSNEEFEASADAVERLLLDYLRPRTFDEFATMDAIIEEVRRRPSCETVRKAVAAIKRPADYQYFFDRLQSPGDRAPGQEGFPRRPPEAEVRAGTSVSPSGLSRGTSSVWRHGSEHVASVFLTWRTPRMSGSKRMPSMPRCYAASGGCAPGPSSLPQDRSRRIGSCYPRSLKACRSPGEGGYRSRPSGWPMRC